MKTNGADPIKSCRILILTASLLALSASMAEAVDGVIEINQARADFGGLPGDSAGYPLSITVSGSYRLTGDLVVPGGVDGIFIAAPDVTLDLNGFTVSGPTVCTTTGDLGSTISCAPTPSGVGIAVNAERVRVHNGQVSGFGFRGIGNSGHQQATRLENLIVSSNGSEGIGFDDTVNMTVQSVTATKNGVSGIMVNTGAQVIGCMASENGGAGIFLHGGSSQVRNNVIRGNGGPGIQFSNGSGIDSMVVGNTVTENAGFAITGGSFFYAENLIDGNLGGTVSGGSEMGTNSCEGNTTCP